jgi:hypothetical protein
MPTSAIAGVFLLILSGLYWIGSDAIPKSAMSGSVGADGLPKLLAVVLAGLSLILIYQSLVVRPSVAAPEEFPEDEDAEFTRRGHFLAAGLLAIAILYVVILPYAGYAISVGLLLLAVAMFYGRRPTLGVIAFAAIAAGIFYLLFVAVLGVRMPAGVLPDLIGWH